MHIAFYSHWEYCRWYVGMSKNITQVGIWLNTSISIHFRVIVHEYGVYGDLQYDLKTTICFEWLYNVIIYHTMYIYIYTMNHSDTHTHTHMYIYIYIWHARRIGWSARSSYTAVLRLGLLSGKNFKASRTDEIGLRIWNHGFNNNDLMCFHMIQYGWSKQNLWIQMRIQMGIRLYQG